MNDAMERLFTACGGRHKLADALGITFEAICYWQSTGKIPVKRVLQCEQLCGGTVSRYAMRPDIYGLAPAKNAA